MIIKPLTITVATDNQISSSVPIDPNYPLLGLEIPTLDATVVYIQGAREDGGTYRRVLKTDGSGDWNIASGTGNKFIFIDSMAPLTSIRIECASAQSADRTFYLIMKK